MKHAIGIVLGLAIIFVGVAAWRSMEPSVIKYDSIAPTDATPIYLDATDDSLPWPTTIVTTSEHIYHIKGGYICQNCPPSEGTFTVKSATTGMIVLALRPEQVKEWHRE